MKTNFLMILALTIVIASGCKSKSAAIKGDGDSTIQLAIEYSEQYCGGVDLTDEEFEELTQPRPFSDGVIYISKMISPEQFEDEVEVKLDKGGLTQLKLDSGMYAVSFYSLVPPAPKEGDDKNEKKEKPSIEAGDNPMPPNGEEMSPEMQKKDCETRWKRMSAMPLKIVGGKTAYMLPMNRECNPCEPPKP